MDYEIDKVSANVMLVDPGTAEKLLLRNTHNRPKSRQHAVKLSFTIKRGEWKLNGEPIIIADDGTLLDGQHRLQAIVMSGITVPVVVVSGVDRSAFDTIDQGRKRTTGDVFSINGENDGKGLSAAVSWVWRYQHNLMLSSSSPSTQQAQMVLEIHPGLRDSLVMGRKLGASRLCQASLGACLHYLFARVERDWADEFIITLADGVGLQRDTPLHTLRQRLEASDPTPV